jgi:hypothetical protein
MCLLVSFRRGGRNEVAPLNCSVASYRLLMASRGGKIFRDTWDPQDAQEGETTGESGLSERANSILTDVGMASFRKNSLAIIKGQMVLYTFLCPHAQTLQYLATLLLVR